MHAPDDDEELDGEDHGEDCDESPMRPGEDHADFRVGADSLGGVAES